jgi:hypothetical protein
MVIDNNLIIMNNKVDYLFPDEEYKPRTADLEKVKHYINVDPTGIEMHAHERDIYTPAP